MKAPLKSPCTLTVIIHLHPKYTPITFLKFHTVIFSQRMYSCEKPTLTSCFSSFKPNFHPRINHRDSADSESSHFHPFNDYYNTNQEIIGNGSDNKSKKSKSRASKIYNNFKRVKQLISSGGRVTSFVSSLFTSGSVTKIKEEGKPSSTNSSKSCFDESVDARGKFDDFGVTKTVHFYPVSIVVDEGSRNCGKTSSCNEEFEFDSTVETPTQTYQISETLKSHILEMNKNFDKEGAQDVFLKWFLFQEKDNVELDDKALGRVSNFSFHLVGSNRYYEDKDDDFAEIKNNGDEDIDRVSSSDLFEIDLDRVFANNGFCEDKNKYDNLEEKKLGGVFYEGVGCFSECSWDLFEIDHIAVRCEEAKARDDDLVSKGLTIGHHDSPSLPPWVPQNWKSLIVELGREKAVPEPILVVSKRFLPSEIESCQNRFKIPRLCF